MYQALNALHVLIHLFLTTSLRNGYFFSYPHFTEAPRHRENEKCHMEKGLSEIHQAGWSVKAEMWRRKVL